MAATANINFRILFVFSHLPIDWTPCLMYKKLVISVVNCSRNWNGTFLEFSYVYLETVVQKFTEQSEPTFEIYFLTVSSYYKSMTANHD